MAWDCLREVNGRVERVPKVGVWDEYDKNHSFKGIYDHQEIEISEPCV